MTRTSELVIEPFTTDLGQTINPGDKVAFVASGYGHRISIETGVYEGVYKNKDRTKVVGSRISKVPVVWRSKEISETGEHEEKEYVRNAAGNYEYKPTGRRYNWVKHEDYRVSSLKLNRLFKL